LHYARLPRGAFTMRAMNFESNPPCGDNDDICESPARNDNVHARVLHEACIASGGENQLAQRLGLPVGVIQDWLHGRGRPTDAAFLRCIDIISRKMS
jgi:hypothetical protein